MRVLGLIVSKLPFRSAVAASAMSRRWRGAVAAAPALDLDFAAAFPAALGSGSAPPHPHSLRRLRLRLALEGLFDQAFAAFAADHLGSWLNAATARGVERLELRLTPLPLRPGAARRPDILNVIRIDPVEAKRGRDGEQGKQERSKGMGAKVKWKGKALRDVVVKARKAIFVDLMSIDGTMSSVPASRILDKFT